MRNLLPAILIPFACVSLAAQSTGRLAGKILGKDGKPVPGVVLRISRKEIKWDKVLAVDSKGSFMQVGLEPKEFDCEISAPGYQTIKESFKIPLADTLTREWTMLTAQEAAEEAAKRGQAGMSESELKSMSGSTAFNSGVEFYNRQEFAAARPHMEKAVDDLREALKTMKEGEERKATESRLVIAERVCGITLYEVGRKDPVNKDMLAKAAPLLKSAFERNPKDQMLANALVEVSKATGNAEDTKKYQAALEALIGPRPELAYNDGVAAFNNGDYKAAKTHVDRAIATDPKFPDSYWLKGVVEFSLNNLKAAKEAFKTYLEKAPNGKKAGEVKEFLKELK
ncbi:MAG TPA: tetratricopeptide repeat protein [Holophaga sp.]|nr:tetratricopeptide repeat protein [Holophaga sp.]